MTTTEIKSTVTAETVSTEPLGKSKRYLRYLLFFLCIMELFDTYATSFPSTVLSYVQADFNITDARMSIILGIAQLGAVGAFFVQLASDKVGRKPFLWVSMLGFGIVSLGFIFIQGAVGLTIVYFLLSLFDKSDIYTIVVAEEAPIKKRGKWTNNIMVIGILGAFFVIIMRIIFIGDGSDPNWRGLGYFGVLAIPCALLLFKVKETEPFLKHKEEKAKPGYVPTPWKEQVLKPFKVEHTSSFIAVLLITLIQALNTSGREMSQIYINRYLTESDYNIYAAITLSFMVLGFFITGFLSDKIGRRKLCYLYAGMMPFLKLIYVYGIRSSNHTIAILSVFVACPLSAVAGQGILIMSRLLCVETMPTDLRGTSTAWRALVYAGTCAIALFINAGLINWIGLGDSFIPPAFLYLLIIPIVYKYLKETKDVDLVNFTE